MLHETPSPETAVDWRRIHALGLPSGSIRALLAILVFATVWALLIIRPSEEIPNYLGDLLFIIMGHYFAARRRVVTDADPGPPPLYLPRGSVRVLLIAGSIAVAVFLFRRGQLTSLERNPGVVAHPARRRIPARRGDEHRDDLVAGARTPAAAIRRRPSRRRFPGGRDPARVPRPEPHTPDRPPGRYRRPAFRVGPPWACPSGTGPRGSRRVLLWLPLLMEPKHPTGDRPVPTARANRSASTWAPGAGDSASAGESLVARIDDAYDESSPADNSVDRS